MLFEEAAHDATLEGAAPDDLYALYRANLDEQFGDSVVVPVTCSPQLGPFAMRKWAVQEESGMRKSRFSEEQIIRVLEHGRLGQRRLP